MNLDENRIQPASLTALHHQYTAAVHMLSQSNSRRTATARFYISIISGLVGLLAIVHRPGVDVETQYWATNILAIFAIILNLVWFMTIKSLRHLAKQGQRIPIVAPGWGHRRSRVMLPSLRTLPRWGIPSLPICGEARDRVVPRRRR